jgi:queuosine precursor transporter
MEASMRRQAFTLYLFLAALFITSLVVSNLIFQKFFVWQPFGEVTVFGAPIFEVSVGILPYPITFLITDLISEIFGKRMANKVVVAGIFASVFSLLIVYTAAAAPATSWSPVADAQFTNVFGNTIVAVFASMMAYLLAQFVDIQIYHFWKRVTQGKHLWLRNNFSTFSSQFIDTIAVVFLLSAFGEISWDRFWGLVIAGFLFKIMIAVADTPVLYVLVYAVKKRFNLKTNEEIDLFETTKATS